MATNVSSLYLYTPRPAEVARPNDDHEDCCSPVSYIMAFTIFWFFGCSICFTLVMMSFHKNNIRDNLIPDIGLKSFSVSNLNIIDNRVSGDWTIGLNLENPAHKAVVYENINFTVVLSTVSNVSIVDFHQGHPSVQPPKNRTTVYLHGWTEKLPLSHITADSMIQDVIDGETVEFDLLMAAKCKNADVLGAGRLELSCKGIKVLILPSKSAPMNAAGFATEIPVCDLVKRRVKDDIPRLG